MHGNALLPESRVHMQSVGHNFIKQFFFTSSRVFRNGRIVLEGFVKLRPVVASLMGCLPYTYLKQSLCFDDSHLEKKLLNVFDVVIVFLGIIIRRYGRYPIVSFSLTF